MHGLDTSNVSSRVEPSGIWAILIYRPMEGGRLSRPRHCSKCAAARAQSCDSQRIFAVRSAGSIREPLVPLSDAYQITDICRNVNLEDCRKLLGLQIFPSPKIARGFITGHPDQEAKKRSFNKHNDIYSDVIYGASHMWEFLWAEVGQRQVGPTRRRSCKLYLWVRL